MVVFPKVQVQILRKVAFHKVQVRKVVSFPKVRKVASFPKVRKVVSFPKVQVRKVVSFPKVQVRKVVSFPKVQDQIHKVVSLVVFPTYPMGKVVFHKGNLLHHHKVV